jgi:hypothetical protein
MRSVTYSIGVSRDGYSVGPDGDVGWTAPDEEVFRFVTDEFREVGVHRSAEDSGQPEMRRLTRVFPMGEVVRGRQVWEKPDSASWAGGVVVSRSTALPMAARRDSARSRPKPSRTTMRSTAMSSAFGGMV